MTRSLPRIGVFPKCYFDELCSGEMEYVDWIYEAESLGAEGIEHYDGFFESLDEKGMEPVLQALQETGQRTSMLCFSPDFTHPDPDERRRQIGRQKEAVDVCVMLGTHFCRTLSGQNYPGMTVEEGTRWTLNGISESLAYAQKRGVTLSMENHYKDGAWEYPEFAQPEDIYLSIVEKIDSPSFGLQYDPSNALIGGYDPIAFLEKIRHRVVTMHASDRYLEPGTTLEDLKRSGGKVGYPDKLHHGVTGHGLNDYDAIFQILSETGFSGWISVEDGMNGLEEIRESVKFLKEMRSKYYGG